MAKCPKCDEEIPIDATEEKDKIEIWRYFREKGDADKGRMVTIATWLLSLAIAILAYLAKNHYVFDPLPFCVKKPYSATIFAVFGIVISIYTLFIVIHLRRQTYKNWLRAELMFNKLQDTSILRQAMDRLVENLKPKKSGDYLNRYNPVSEGFPRIFKPFLVIAWILVIIFVLAVILSLVSHCCA